MILRKPYGFLIKHFRTIHFCILVLLCYIIYKTQGLLEFFQSYISAGYTTRLTDFANDYFNPFVLLIFVLTITSLIAIFFLMKSKEKSTKYYIFTTIYYTILLIIFFLSYNTLVRLQSTTVAASTLRVYRDILNIVYYPQFISIVYTLLRAVGFDIKSFNFNKDLEDLDLVDEDEEEVELNINIEGYKVKRTTRRTIRELKYYVLENKFVFSILGGGALLAIFISLIVNFQVYNKRYSMNESFVLSNTFDLTFKSSILTDRDYQGNVIQPGRYYLAVVVNIKNRTTSSKAIDTNNFKIEVGDKKIYPTPDRSGKFLDMGAAYYGDKIAPGVQTDYVIAYELEEEDLKSTYTIKLVDSIEYTETEIIPKHKIIKLRPILETDPKVVKTVSLKENLNLEQTALGKSNFKIDDYTITDRYEYTYDFCYNDICYPSKNLVTVDLKKHYNQTLLVLDANLNLDNSTFYATDRSVTHNFYDDFITIKYTLNGEEKKAEVVDITPQQVKDKVILRTTASLEKATKITASITIRSNTYEIEMKK